MKPFASTSLWAVALIGVLPSPAADAPNDWHATAEECRLKPAHITAIERHGFVLVDEDLRQCYQGLLGPRTRRSGPSHLGTFVTSDVLLAMTNACLDEAGELFEAHQAHLMRDWFQTLWNTLPTTHVHAAPGEDELLQAGMNHARFILAVELTLLRLPPEGLDATLQDAVNDEVARIDAAAAAGTPPWLPEPHRLDYRAMRPTHFYERNPVLAGLYRARVWYEKLGFDLLSDRDVLAMAILADLDLRRGDYANDRIAIENTPMVGSPTRTMPSFGGARFFYALVRTNPTLRAALTDIRDALTSPTTSVENSDLRAYARDRLHHEYAAQLAKAKDANPKVENLMTWWGIAHFGVPEFAPPLLMESPEPPRPWWRTEHLRANEAVATQSWKAVHRFFDDTGWSDVAGLLGFPADPAAPGIFSGEAWRLKSFQTALVASAQSVAERPVHARVDCCSSSGYPSGKFVIEPVPRFFGALANRLEQLARLEDPEGPWPRAISIATEARWWAAFLTALGDQRVPEAFRYEVDALSAWQGAPAIDAQVAAGEFPYAEIFGYNYGGINTEEILEALRGERYESLIAALLDAADHLEHDGKLAGRKPPFAKHTWRGRNSLAGAARLVRRLEALCHKQLRGLPFDDAEQSFLHGLVESIAWKCLDYQEGTSRIEDTEARIAAVPDPEKPGTWQHVATGRPMAIYILYPINGVPTLLRGAVMTYREFERDHVVTNDKWRAELDRDPTSGRPAWLAPLFREPADN